MIFGFGQMAHGAGMMSIDATEVNAAAGIFKKLREISGEPFARLDGEKWIEQDHLKGAVELQENAEEEPLIPGAPLAQPGLGINVRIKDVMEMNDHAARQTRQDAKKDFRHVAPRFGDVRRVDEEEVIFLEFIEH